MYKHEIRVPGVIAALVAVELGMCACIAAGTETRTAESQAARDDSGNAGDRPDIRMLRSPDRETVESIVFTPDGAWFVASSRSRDGGSGTLSLYDSAGVLQRRSAVRVTSLVRGAGGQFVGSSSGTVAVISVPSLDVEMIDDVYPRFWVSANLVSLGDEHDRWCVLSPTMFREDPRIVNGTGFNRVATWKAPDDELLRMNVIPRAANIVFVGTDGASVHFREVRSGTGALERAVRMEAPKLRSCAGVAGGRYWGTFEGRRGSIVELDPWGTGTFTIRRLGPVESDVMLVTDESRGLVGTVVLRSGPDGSFLVRAAVHDVAGGSWEERGSAEFELPGFPWSFAIAPSGSAIAIGGGAGVSRLVRLRPRDDR